MNNGTLFEPSKLSIITYAFDENLGAFFDTPKFQRFWGIVRNILLPFSSFQRSEVVGRKTTGRHEMWRGVPQEWVRKTAYFGGICTRIAVGRERK
jgi:hypothetical protein